MRSRLPGALAWHRPSSSCAQTSAFKPGGCYFALAAAASPASVPNWDRCTSSEPLPILMTANATTDQDRFPDEDRELPPGRTRPAAADYDFGRLWSIVWISASRSCISEKRRTSSTFDLSPSLL